MSKSVRPDREFNKEEFCNLLRMAIGYRTQAEFAEDADLSPSFISKCLNDAIDKAPIPSTLKKIAEASDDEVMYSDLLLAAGYDPKKYDKPDFSESCTLHMLSEIVDMFKKQGVSILGDDLTGYRYTYNIIYTKDCSTIKTYYVNYIPTYLDHTLEYRCHEYFQHLCGLLAQSNKPGPIKAIIITNSMKVFSEISKAKAPHLAVYLSAVLIDPTDFKPFMEKPLETAFRITEEIEKFSLAPNQ